MTWKTFSFFILCFLTIFCKPKTLAKDTLFILLDSGPDSLDPRRATDASGMRIVDLIFSSLLKSEASGKLVSDMAYKWEQKGLTYTFYLKSDLYFSNGRPVHKEDILFSFEEFQKKTSPFYSAFKNIKSVQVLHSKNPISKKENFILKIFVKKFQANFLYVDLPVIKILPKKEILESPLEFEKKPIGSGDFELVKKDFYHILLKRKKKNGLPFHSQFSKTHSPDSTKKEHGYKKDLFPEFLSFQIVRDSFTRTQKMISGESDIAPSVLPLYKIVYFKKQKEKFHVFAEPGLSTTYLLLNLKNPVLKKRLFRKALSLSINRPEIIKYKLKSYAVPAQTFFHFESEFFNKNIAPPSFNLKEAKQIIQKMGVQGVELTLSLSSNSDTIDKAKVLASQMSRSGVKVSIQSNEWGIFYRDISQGNYDMAFIKWVGVKDPDIYRVAFYGKDHAPRGRNRSFYSNPFLDQLLDEGLQTQEKKKRKQIYDRVQKIIAEDFVVLPLWHDMEVSVVRKNVKHYKIRKNGDFLSLPFVKK